MMQHLKTKWSNKVATMAERWESGAGVSYGSASVMRLDNTRMVTVDYLGTKTKKKKELSRRQSRAMANNRKVSAVKSNLYIAVHHQQ